MTRVMGPGACDGARYVYNYTFMLISVNLLFRVSLINTDKTEREPWVKLQSVRGI